MSYANVYYTPEAFGLEIVGEIEWSDECYQFDKTVVWRNKESGKLYYADDSGCSCPSPFENDDVSTLTRIDRPQDLIDHLAERTAGASPYSTTEMPRLEGDVGSLILKVRDLK